MSTNSERDSATADIIGRLRQASIDLTADEALCVLDDAAWIGPARAAAERIVQEEMVMFEPPRAEDVP